MGSPIMFSEFSEEADPSFENELTVLLRNVNDGRRIHDLRVSLKSVKESMDGSFSTPFESPQEPFIL